MKQIYSILFFLLISTISFSQTIISQTQATATITRAEFGQSFTAPATGDFTDITLYVNSSSSYAGTATMELRSGDGLSGTILATETINVVDQPSGYQQKFTFSTPASITLGNIYTMRFTGPGAFSTTYTLDVATGDPLPGGVIYQPTSFPGADLTFEATIDDSVLSIDDLELVINKFKIYPNPSTDYIKISGISNTENYKIINAAGQQIIKGIITDNGKIDIKVLSYGLYYLQLGNENILKFIKQ